MNHRKLQLLNRRTIVGLFFQKVGAYYRELVEFFCLRTNIVTISRVVHCTAALYLLFRLIAGTLCRGL